MPLDPAETAKIREQFADDASRGQIEQAASAYRTARELGQETAMQDARNRMAGLGYESDDAAADRKAAAAAERKAAAEDAKDDSGGETGKAAKGPAPAQTGTRNRATRAGHASGGKD